MAKSEPIPGPNRPLGDPEIPQCYLPVTGQGGKIYAPRIYGAAKLQFGDRRRGLEETRRVAFVVPVNPTGRTLDWDAAKATDVMPEQLLKKAPQEAPYLPLSTAATQVAAFTRWARGFDRWVARTQRAEFSTRQDPAEAVTLAPRRGGVSVELVAIAWELQ